MLTGPRLPDPAGQVDGRTLRARGFSDDARALLEHVWALMGMPCGKYLVVMLGQWLPLLAAAGDLGKPFATEQALAELGAMSAATVDRVLEAGPGQDADQGHFDDETVAAAAEFDHHPHLRRRGARGPGVIEADTVAHCGPTLIGEFARTLTMTDVVTGCIATVDQPIDQDEVSASPRTRSPYVRHQPLLRAHFT